MSVSSGLWTARWSPRFHVLRLDNACRQNLSCFSHVMKLLFLYLKSPAMMVLPAPGSSASRKRRGGIWSQKPRHRHVTNLEMLQGLLNEPGYGFQLKVCADDQFRVSHLLRLRR